MDRVAEDDPAFFLVLQAYAKTCADNDSLRIVFVFSDGAALPLLLSSSAASRCGDVYEVGEIDDAAAAAYVVERFGRDAAWAAELVATVTGGRFAALELFGRTKRALDEVRSEVVRLMSAAEKLSVPLKVEAGSGPNWDEAH